MPAAGGQVRGGGGELNAVSKPCRTLAAGSPLRASLSPPWRCKRPGFRASGGALIFQLQVSTVNAFARRPAAKSRRLAEV